MSISIQGIDKVKLLKALWENAKPDSLFNNIISPPQWNDANAAKVLENKIDYYCGRCIKCNLSGESVDPSLYDYAWGTRVFEKVVKSIL